jgi:cytochrome b involved in lipid metabolism
MDYTTFVKSIDKLPTYTKAEVAIHSDKTDCWVILTNIFADINKSLVIDVTSFIRNHPGGSYIMLPYLGIDCTNEFLQYHVETNSSSYNTIMKLCIGSIKD